MSNCIAIFKLKHMRMKVDLRYFEDELTQMLADSID